MGRYISVEKHGEKFMIVKIKNRKYQLHKHNDEKQLLDWLICWLSLLQQAKIPARNACKRIKKWHARMKDFLIFFLITQQRKLTKCYFLWNMVFVVWI